jgi:amino acid adenylation domain-containing protein
MDNRMNSGDGGVEDGPMVFPTSFAQQRMWFLHQWQPETPLYNSSWSVKLDGRLDVAALEHALNNLVQRHESLRTTFSVVDGQPVQVVAPNPTVGLPLFDLSCLPEGGREAEALRLATDETRRAFDLTRGPLLRVRLLRLDEQQHVLILVFHHIVSDGWSRAVLFRELSELYDASCAGEPYPLSDLPIQYSDYAVWQREWLQGEVLEDQLSYWKEQLADAPGLLKLPTDRQRPAIQTHRGATQFLKLSQPLTDRLKALSRRENASLFMTLLAAFQTLLHRYTDQDDILVGTPIAGRTRPETEGLIGFFANTLVLRGDLSGDPSFRELLRRVRGTALDAYDHQELPFEKLVEELRPQRSFSHSPLFQVMFAFQNAPTLNLGGLTIKPLRVERDTATFDLSLMIDQEPRSLYGALEYNTDLFDGSTIRRMIGHFHTLLEAIVADPERRLSELPILTEPERRQLLTRHGDERVYEKDDCIHERFEAQANRRADAVALVFEGQQLAYGELNSRANQLAHYLRVLGVGAESLVAICVERSLEMVVGILGVLKAGAAYVPLDATYPKERLGFMLRDSQAEVVLTEQPLLERLFDGGESTSRGVAGVERQVKVVCLDTDWEVVAGQSKHNPPRVGGPDNLAYVIYTSGSTGNPKGVLVTHHNVVRLLEATEGWFGFGASDVWTLFHSDAFDFSVWEMWGALLYGGRLVVVSHWVSRSPQTFHELLSREQVTVLNQTPAAFRQLIQLEQSTANLPRLAVRLVIFGGEALDFQSLAAWFDRHGDQRPQLVNMYGITETTVHVTYRPITAADVTAKRGSLIGMPLRDLDVYVLDRNHSPVPIGIPGELYVGGAGLARGYLNRPELTAERFVPNPFCRGSGERLYRSGDLVRYLPNRGIEYLGRVDGQVKIRGFRIELGEIEAVLRQHPAVRDAVVVARDDWRGLAAAAADANSKTGTTASGDTATATSDKCLVVYVVACDDRSVSTSDLRGYVKSKLPEHMMPSVFVMLEHLPLTANGKLDRGKLPPPDQYRPEQDGAFTAPRTPVEKLLAAIWAEVLKIDRVGIHDNFFDLGGHSLLITQVASRIQRSFQVELPLRILFDAPTISTLTGAIATAQFAQEDAAEAAHMLSELKRLTPDEVKALLDAES